MRRTAQDFIALVDGDKPALAGRAKYYRALAAVLLAQVESVKSVEARTELASLAADYERLAAYMEQTEKPTSGEKARWDLNGGQSRQVEGSD